MGKVILDHLGALHRSTPNVLFIVQPMEVQGWANPFDMSKPRLFTQTPDGFPFKRIRMCLNNICPALANITHLRQTWGSNT